MAGTIVTVGDVSSSITTRVYRADTGEQLWTANHGNAATGVAMDNSGNVYTVGLLSSNLTTRKYNNTGKLLWSVNHGAKCNGVAVDSEGNVITGGNRTSNITTRKYDSDGTEITSGWPLDHGATVWSVAVDSSDNVYTAGNTSSSVNVRKYNSGGTLQWNGLHGTETYSVCADGTVAVCGKPNTLDSNRTTRINRTGTSTWQYSYAQGDYRQAIAQARDTSGDLIASYVVVGTRVSSVTTQLFVASSGTNTWTADHGQRVNAVCIDRNDGSVYTGGNSSSSVTTRKYAQDGTQNTDDNWPLNHGATVFGIAWSPWEPTIIPGLAIPLGLWMPLCTFSAASPALSLGLQLGSPTVPARPAPPDVAAGAQVYRLYLTGGSSLIELPMSGLQCRRRLGESTWLTVEIPTYSTVLAAAIAAVATRELVIYAGVVMDGVETSGEMMRATLTEIRSEWDGWHGSVQLTGRVTPSTATVTSFSLAGVRQRGKDEQGRRTVTCAVDPRIRPNHTVNDGLYSFTVGSILYRISPADAVMWIAENG